MNCEVTMVGIDKIAKYLSAKEFLHEVKFHRERVKKTRFIPPRLGDGTLGKFYIEYNYVPTKTTAEKQ